MRDLEALEAALLRLDGANAITLLVAPADRLDAFARLDIELVRSALGEADSRFRAQRVCSPRTPDAATEQAFLARIEARGAELGIPIVVRARVPGALKHVGEWLAQQGPAPKRAYRVEKTLCWYTDDGRFHTQRETFDVDAASGWEAARIAREHESAVVGLAYSDSVLLLDLDVRREPSDDFAPRAQPPQASDIRKATLAGFGVEALIALTAHTTPFEAVNTLSASWQVPRGALAFVSAFLRGELTTEEAGRELAAVRPRLEGELRLAQSLEEALSRGTLTRETVALGEARTISAIRWLMVLADLGLGDAKQLTGMVASLGDAALEDGAFHLLVEEIRMHARQREGAPRPPIG